MAGQTTSQWWFLVTLWILILKNRYRAIIATDRRILVLDTGRWAMTKPKSVIRELPRATQIGPASGLWYRTDALGEKLYIHKRFHKDIAAADAARGAGPAGSPLPPPPQ